MSIKTSHGAELLRRARKALALRFSLLDDKADDAVIDETIRGGVELRGATPWILIFAIFIASIGLNVNSTAVIIGAMLISPLMGPIMGVGYGIGIYDFPLIRKSLLNLGIATLIGLVTSAFYFSISPLSDAQSELLSRTTPTIWDVLIAFFGGLSGVVGSTRKEKSNVIPGVAIATALMPPLCTAGYGLASQNWSFFAGAFYLFAINCVFIAFSTVLIIGVLHPSHRQFVDPQVEARVRRTLFAIVLITMLPSVYLAFNLVKDEAFSSKARQFVKREFRFEQAHVTDVQIAPAQRLIEVTLIGEPLGRSAIETIRSRLGDQGLTGASIVVHQAADNHIDVTSLKAGIASELYRESLRDLAAKEMEIERLKTEVATLSGLQAQGRDIALELKAQYPQLEDVVAGYGIEPAGEPGREDRRVFILSAISPVALTESERARIKEWFQVRAKSKSVYVMLVAPATEAATRKKVRSHR